MTNREILTNYLASFVSSLVDAGVEEVVISPGSRSTPLALLMAEHRELQVYIHIDERSAAFFALGLAKASKKPVAILCTSGTAAANYYPAVVEAHLSRVPLIVLTADRPHELRDVGAPQAIDQQHLYGHHVLWFMDMALPEAGAETYAKTAAKRAVKEAMGLRQGPVHLNFPLREPLIPNLDPYPFPTDEQRLSIETGHLTLPKAVFENIAEQMNRYSKGIIICGPIDKTGFPKAVKALADQLGYPIFADPLSQLRGNASVEDAVIDSYDAILKTEEIVSDIQPEIVIHFGASPVSKPLALFLKKFATIPYIIVDGGMGWRDPNYKATRMIYCDEVDFCEQLLQLAKKRVESQWLTMWKKIDDTAKNMIAAHFNDRAELDEGRAIYELANCLPMKSTVFVGNSMPIRDIDTFFHKTEKNICVLANRGANGIDGVVSTAIGSAIHKRPLFLVIGDLSFFHDLNGLLMTKFHSIHMIIILLNNDGGGIFSYLPQADEPKHFEVLFGTPTGLNFEYAVRMYQGNYTKICDWEGFRLAVEEAVNNRGLHVLEIPTDRAENLASHRKMWDRISREIKKDLLGDKE